MLLVDVPNRMLAIRLWEGEWGREIFRPRMGLSKAESENSDAQGQAQVSKYVQCMTYTYMYAVSLQSLLICNANTIISIIKKSKDFYKSNVQSKCKCTFIIIF